MMNPPVPLDISALHNEGSQRIRRGAMPRGNTPQRTSSQENVNLDELLRAIRRGCTFLTQPFSVNNAAKLLRPGEDRTYFMIQNTGISPLYVAFGDVPTPASSLNLLPGGFAEPYQIPSNDIYILSTAVGTTGILIYSIGN